MKEKKVITIIGLCIVAFLVSGVFVVKTFGDINKSKNTPVSSPGEAAKNHTVNEINGRWDLAYDDLLSQQQAVISKNLYVSCGERNTLPKLTVDVVDVRNENYSVPGVGNLDSTAVTLKFSLLGESKTKTVHEYKVGNSWKSSVDQATFDAESKGVCK